MGGRGGKGEEETVCGAGDVGRRVVHGAKEFCCSSKGSEDGGDCIWIGNQASLWKIREKSKHKGHNYSPGLVIVRRSSCRCCCKRKQLVRALI